MKTIKVAEATGTVLEWLVATCEAARVGATLKPQAFLRGMEIELFSFSTEWSQGGPIKEREGITSGPVEGGGFWAGKCLINDDETIGMNGPTELVAIMRCHVQSIMGDEVEIPDELV